MQIIFSRAEARSCRVMFRFLLEDTSQSLESLLKERDLHKYAAQVVQNDQSIPA